MSGKKKLLAVEVILFGLLIFNLSPSPLWSGKAETRDIPIIQVTTCEQGPKIDGELNDPVWEKAPEITDFITVFPTFGLKPSEKTAVKIIRDRENLYFGVYCYDREPARISANTMAHDVREFSRNPGDDVVKILLDPYQDKRNAYVFIVNALGARAEGLASGEHLNLSWDGIWEAKSKIQSDGWTTEIRIPFKTIGFNRRLNTWGINIERYIPRKQETIRLAAKSQNSFFTNANEAAVLEGINGINQGLGLTIKPYSLVSSAKDLEVSPITHYDWQGGFDLYKRFTPNFTGAATYNTDFAETEADERRINLTRFPLYFPEKRTFFLEGSEIFNFGPGGMGYFSPFFSRRIGLYEGHQIPIDFGLKLFGKIDRTNLAILDMKTKPFSDEAEGINLAGQNFLAARVYQDIFEESRVGFIFTNGEPTGEKNTLAGFDFVYQTSRFQGNKNFLAGFWYLYNWNSLANGYHQAYGLRLDYPNDLWDLNASYNFYGDSFNPGIGFVSRTGVRNASFGLAYQPRPEKGLVGELVRQFFFEFRSSFYWNLDGQLETSRIFLAPLNFRTESGEHIEFNVIVNRDVLPEEFEVSEGVIIPAGPYDFTQYSFQLDTASFRPWVLELRWNTGQFYSGHYNDFEAAAAFRINGYATFSLKANLVRGVLPQGNFTENVYELKADFFLNPNLGLMNYIQYDSVSKNLGVNSRLRWIITPGNEIFFIFSKSWERVWDPTSRFEPLAGRAVFKVTLSIRP
ncbi:MAG: DUF5916 domain-containing protein [Candidatus Saccharicenans sp.]